MSVTEEGMGALQRGRKRYQEKDYAGAVQAFSEARKISTDHFLLKALDGRAASYEKLDKLQLALRDAKEMIDVSPKVAKGYLRCGKVLQLKKQSELALKIYERGLTKVKIGTDEERTTLQSMYTKLRMELNPGKSLDPLEFLPLELAQMVCQNLEMRDRVICLSVTKSWKKLVESSHGLWTTFDTTKARKALSDRSFRAHLKRSNYTLDRAIFSIRSGIDVKKMQFLTRACTNLKEIRIHGHGSIGASLYEALPNAKNLNTLYVSQETEITLSSVQKIMEICKATLVDMTFLNIQASTGGFIPNRWPMMPSLRHLSLRGSVGAECLDIDGLRDNTPLAKTVNLRNWKVMPDISNDLTLWKQLERLDVTNTQLRHLPNLPPSLRHLSLSGNPHLHVPHTEYVEEDAAFKLPRLESFDCSSTGLFPKCVERITRQAISHGNLKSLGVGHCLGFTSSKLEDFPPSKELKTLSVPGLGFRDNLLCLTAGRYPSLRCLDVSQNPITGVTVREAVKAGVTKLTLNGCGEISSDAIEWARGQGVDVTHIMNAERLSRAQLWAQN